MNDDDIDAESMKWLAEAFLAGETDFKERALTELRRIERGERRLIGQAANVAAASKHRERADAMKGAISLIDAIPLKGAAVS